MDEVVTELSKPIWWISVVVAGIVINLLSSYIKTQLDRSILSTASWLRRHSTRRQEKWNEIVSHIATDEGRRWAEVSEVRARLQSIQLNAVAILTLVLVIFTESVSTPIPRWAIVAMMALSATSFTLAFQAFQHASYLARAQVAARRPLVVDPV